ncbi:MAG: aldehyde-activating protein [Ponticaulis sp.]|nr:aldehyde-activating protein [Ponticaulis sp.]
MKLTGECFCGNVRYEIDGDVFGARSCHCSRCRKAFSAQASAFAMVKPDTFQWLSGQELLTDFVGEHGAGKQFCSKCGSTLTGIYQGQVMGITLGTLNDDPGIVLDTHIHVASKANWEVLPSEGVKTYETFPPEWMKPKD